MSEASAVVVQKERRVYAIPTGMVHPSPTNPRKTYNEQKVRELADSIKANGGHLIHPVPVRKKEDDYYEIVVGERRWRAHVEANLPTIDAEIVVMTDQAVAELQLVENCQREDVDPLEEADGFKRLIDSHEFTVEKLAARIGKTLKYVGRRLRLTTLPTNAREALARGDLVLGSAELVALLPPEVQAAAADDLARGTPFGDPLSIEAAKTLILEKYTLGLARAPFDTTDADLAPAAGPCTTCPKRTGCQGVLFEGVAGNDVCTDPACFADKKERAWKLRVVQAKDEGKAVLTKAEAKTVFALGNQVAPTSGYVDLGATCESDPKGRTFKKLLGSRHGLPIVLARDRAGCVHELVRAIEAHKALQDAGHKLKLPKAPPVVDPERAREERRQAEEKAQRKQALLVATIDLAVGEVVERWEKRQPTKAFWLWLVGILLHDSNGHVLGRRKEQLGPMKADAHQAITTLSEDELRALALELSLEGSLYENWQGKPSAELRDLCSQLKVDLKALERTAKEQIAQAAAVADTKASNDASTVVSAA